MQKAKVLRFEVFLFHAFPSPHRVIASHSTDLRMSVLLRLVGPAAAGLAPAAVASCKNQTPAPPASSSGAVSGAEVHAKPAELRRRLTPLGRTSLLTEIETNRSVPMYLMRVK